MIGASLGHGIPNQTAQDVADGTGQLKHRTESSGLGVTQSVHLKIHRRVVEGVPRNRSEQTLAHQAQEGRLGKVAPQLPVRHHRFPGTPGAHEGRV